jgi:Holliday junction resolvasome RuvABC DNA-binding subunit
MKPGGSPIGRRPNTCPNLDIAGRLDEVATIFAEQGANRFRVQAYRKAGNVLRRLRHSVAEIFQREGIEGVEKIPGVGASIARAIRDILLHGRLAMLDRLRGESEAIAILASVPGIGRKLARRFHDELRIETLEELEVAAHDGRIQNFPGIGAKRLAGIRDSLAQRLGRIRRMAIAPHPRRLPPVAELLDVDREYREKAAAGKLTQIAPRCHYTALFSNTAHAHELGKTRDWVVLFSDNGDTEHRFTVITSEFSWLQGERIVAGREAESEKYYDRALTRPSG